MRTGIALSTLREEVLREAGYSTEAGHAAIHAEYINQLLRRNERLLAQQYSWEPMQVERTVTVAADAQFGTMPADIAYIDVAYVHVLYGDQWLAVTHGIGPVERSIYGTTYRTSPIARWEIQGPAMTSFEVWPIGSEAQTLRFMGRLKLGAMTADTDTCQVDADVLVLSAAAEILARDGKADAQFKLQQAQRHAATISKAMGASKAEPVNMAGRRVSPPRPYIDYIP